VDVEIRLATFADTEGIVGTVREVYDEYCFTWEEVGYHADLYDVVAHYFDEGHLFWVAAAGERIVGTTALEMFAPIPGEPGALVWVEDNYRIAACDCALQRLYVRSEARGGGIGTRLFKQVLKAAREQSCRAMEIWSDKRFVDAHRLYQRFGAVVAGDRICNDPDKAPEWGLILETEKTKEPA
jgi:putative acetyltransferase